MLKREALAYIRRMARMYEHSDNLPRRAAIFQAYKSYEFYKEAEVEIIDEQYQRDVFGTEYPGI